MRTFKGLPVAAAILLAAIPLAACAPAGQKAATTAKGDTISRIVPTLAPGTHVTTSKNDVDHVVTEFGVARLRGKSAGQRAAELIAIAHPQFREELTAQARHLRLL